MRMPSELRVTQLHLSILGQLLSCSHFRRKGIGILDRLGLVGPGGQSVLPDSSLDDAKIP